MRLIDADDLRWTNLKDGFGRINTCIVFESDINAMPTIEAIPIDWICSWWGKQGVPSLSHCLENTDEVIRTMLRDWEDENETTD